MGSPVKDRNFDPSYNGIAAYRYLVTDAFLRCGNELHDDARYAAEVRRLRVLAQKSILREWQRWKELRDGWTMEDGTHVPGFWVNDDGEPLQPGEHVPKEAYLGMEGAIQEILHLDGLYWIKKRQKTKAKGAYQAAWGEEE